MADTTKINSGRNCKSEDMVGMGEIKVLKEEGTLWAVLGSCIGLVLYDSAAKIGGIAHIMLGENDKNDSNVGKYADTAIGALIKIMVDKGAVRSRIKARMIGGANMFRWKSTKSCVDIGTSNIETVKKVITEEHIPIVNSTVGGNTGYKIRFSVSDGTVSIRFIDGRTLEI